MAFSLDTGGGEGAVLYSAAVTHSADRFFLAVMDRVRVASITSSSACGSREPACRRYLSFRSCGKKRQGKKQQNNKTTRRKLRLEVRQAWLSLRSSARHIDKRLTEFLSSSFLLILTFQLFPLSLCFPCTFPISPADAHAQTHEDTHIPVLEPLQLRTGVVVVVVRVLLEPHGRAALPRRPPRHGVRGDALHGRPETETPPRGSE